MKTIKYAFVLGLAAALAPCSKAATVDFHFGSATQTGAAAMGATGDQWNAAAMTDSGPQFLKDVTGKTTAISASWTSGDAWTAPRAISASTGGTAMDAATTGLMGACASSYSYTGTATNLALNLTGLGANQSYTLVLYAAGAQKGEGASFTVTGSTTVTGATTGADRKISAGAGVAYTVIQAVSSSAGTLKVAAAKSGYPYATMNGFQLISGSATVTTPPVVLVPVAAPVTSIATTGGTSGKSGPVNTNSGSSSTTGTGTPVTPTAPSTPMTWGICGHPTWSDYASWVPANVASQMSDINQLGATYYRVSFEGADYASYLDKLVPKAQAAGITLLPVLPIKLVAANSAQTNYSNNYTIGYTWATYAIAHGYKLPYWELGNEVENWSLVSVKGDGSSPDQFPDKTPGGFVAIASGMDGAYDGIKDAYAAGQNAGQTTITPQVMIGMCFRHYGLLTKIQNYNNGELPCDLLSWHWYGPNYGNFNGVVNMPGAADNGRTPAACLADFKSKTDPTKPMDIWMTETNRSQVVNGKYLNGSTADDSTPTTSQDWAAEATAVQNNIDSFKSVPSVKAIFVFELYDETKADNTSTSLLAEQGFFGLVTSLGGTKKNAFYTYKTEIQNSK